MITLVIIGVIAAITVPTLITKYQKEQTVTRLKKAYSSLAQTTARAIADNGPIINWDIGENGNADAAKNFLNKYMTPYLNIQEKPTTHSEGNWNTVFYTLNNGLCNYDNGWVRFYLIDGTSVSAIVAANTSVKRILLYIDINGEKKPNKMGKDLFEYNYYILSPDTEYMGKLVPSGSKLTREELVEEADWRCHKKKQGTSCAALIMKDGWQIKDDYPW